MEKLTVRHKAEEIEEIPIKVEFLGNIFCLDEVCYLNTSKVYECAYLHIDDMKEE